MQLKFASFAKLVAIGALTTLIFVVGGASPSVAKPWWMRGSPSDDGDFLPPDVAFRVGAHLDGNVIRVRFVIADGYYLYRRKIVVEADSPDLSVSAPALPAGVLKTDPNLGVQEVYEHGVEAAVAFSRFDAGAHPLAIRVTYQGCAEAGLCYLPISKILYPEGANAAGSASLPIAVPGAAAPGSRVSFRPWQRVAILGGLAAFVLTGLRLRRSSRPLPAAGG